MTAQTSTTLAPRFAGKAIIVTGAGSGMGRAILHRLAGEGGNVLGVDVNEEGLRETVAQAEAIAGFGGRASWIKASIADEQAVKSFVADFAGKNGGIDVLVNMAAILQSAHTAHASLEHFMAVLQVNLVGTFLCCREALPHLEKRGGNIVNCASTAAQFGHPYLAAYSASKGGIAGLTQAIAKEYMMRGVRVNAIMPGGIDTPMMRNTVGGFPEGADLRLLANLARPDHGFGEVHHVASVVAMLASGDGGFMHGATVRIDGGVHG